MKPGIYDNISNKDYHRKIGLSKSGLVNFLKSPEYYQWRLQNPTDPTPAMKLGTHVHTRILEPTRHRETYIVAPAINKRTKAGKAEWAEFQAANEGKEIVTQDEMDIVNAMAESVGRSETASALLSGGTAEQSVFWNDPVHGFLCKCRPDYLNPKYEVIIDLKTTNDISPEAFSKSVANFKYHFQAVHYLAGCEAVMPGQYGAFIFVCVESKEPYPVAVYVLDQESLNLAEVEMEPLLSRYAQCVETDTWPGPPDEVEVISLPGWAKNRVLFN